MAPAALAAQALLLLSFCAAVLVAADPSGQSVQTRSTDRVFRVLAIGDSITQGAVPTQRLLHPYTLELQVKLKQLMGSRVADVDAQAAGVGWAGVVVPSIGKHPTDLVVHTQQLLGGSSPQDGAAGTDYDWVVVLAGINDLTRGNQSADAIMPRLEKVWQMALDSGANVLAIPPLQPGNWGPTAPNMQQRERLIEMMTERVASMRRSCAAGRPCITMTNPAAKGGPFALWDMSQDKRDSYLCDGLHLTPEAYDQLGALIALEIYKQTVEAQIHHFT